MLLLAAALRVWGVTFGLPYRYHIDEPYYVVGALRLAQGDFQLTVPHNTPNLWQFVLLAEYGLMYLVGLLVGTFGEVGDVARLYVTDPTVFYVLARLTSVVCGVATVALVVELGKRLYGARAGLASGLFLAVAFLPARDAHYAVNDAFVTLLTTFTCLAAVRWVSGGDRRLLVLGWAACGAVTGMKYRPVAFALPLALAVLDRARAENRLRARPMAREAALALAAGAAGFLVGVPGVVLNTNVFLSQLGAAFAQGAVSYEGWIVDELPGWLYYLWMLKVGVGIPMLAFAVLGMVAAWKERRREVWLLVAASAGYFALIAPFQTYFARYLMPLFPIVAVLAGGGVHWFGESLAAGMPRRGTAARLVATVAVVVVPLVATLRHDTLAVRVDTRTEAKAWIEQNLPAGSRIAVDWPIHGPPLSTEADSEPVSTRSYDVVVAFGKGLGDRTLEEWRADGVEYLVTSSYISEIGVVDTEHDARRREFYRSLDREASKLAEFLPYRGERPEFVFDQIYGPITDLWRFDRPGPELRVYGIGPSVAEGNAAGEAAPSSAGVRRP